jgi:hypothetical protein
MSKKKNGRNIRLEYHYDRLSNRKMAQVYQMLVPFPSPILEAKTCISKDNCNDNDSMEKGGQLNEANGDLCSGFIEQTKGGKND